MGGWVGIRDVDGEGEGGIERQAEPRQQAEQEAFCTCLHLCAQGQAVLLGSCPPLILSHPTYEEQLHLPAGKLQRVGARAAPAGVPLREAGVELQAVQGEARSGGVRWPRRRARRQRASRRARRVTELQPGRRGAWAVPGAEG